MLIMYGRQVQCRWTRRHALSKSACAAGEESHEQPAKLVRMEAQEVSFPHLPEESTVGFKQVLGERLLLKQDPSTGGMGCILEN